MADFDLCRLLTGSDGVEPRSGNGLFLTKSVMSLYLSTGTRPEPHPLVSFDEHDVALSLVTLTNLNATITSVGSQVSSDLLQRQSSLETICAFRNR